MDLRISSVLPYLWPPQVTILNIENIIKAYPSGVYGDATAPTAPNLWTSQFRVTESTTGYTFDTVRASLDCGFC